MKFHKWAIEIRHVRFVIWWSMPWSAFTKSREWKRITISFAWFMFMVSWMKPEVINSTEWYRKYKAEREQGDATKQ